LKTRHVIAGLAATALVIGLLAFVYLMGVKVNEWTTRSVSLSFPARTLLALSTLIATYWYVVYPGVVMACFGVAELLGGGGREGSEG
jgi:hypothetical protein